MAALTAKQVRNFAAATQDIYRRIDREDWDAARRCYRTPSDTFKWQAAATEALPTEYQDWIEIIRVLAQGESYYGGEY